MDRISRRISTAILIAGALIGLGIYARPTPNDFDAFVAGGEMFRVNGKTGTVIACNATRCMSVVRRGQRLMSYKEGRLFQGQQALPAPQAQPADATPQPRALPQARPAEPAQPTG